MSEGLAAAAAPSAVVPRSLAAGRLREIPTSRTGRARAATCGCSAPTTACRSSAQPPRPGATPSQIVHGFLQSSADFQNDHEVARLYLTTARQPRWRPQAGTQVYDRRSCRSSSRPPTPSTVVFDGAEVGRHRRRRHVPAGAEVGTAGDPAVPAWRRSNGEWRIADLDDGLLLSSSRRSARPTARSRSTSSPRPAATLVPDPVLLPELPGLTHQAGRPAAARSDRRRCAARVDDRVPAGHRAGGRARCRCATASRPCASTPRPCGPTTRRASRCPRRSSGRSSSCPRSPGPDHASAARTCWSTCRRRGAEPRRLAHLRPRPAAAAARRPTWRWTAGSAATWRASSSRCPVRGDRRRRGAPHARRVAATTAGWRRSAPTAGHASTSAGCRHGREARAAQVRGDRPLPAVLGPGQQPVGRGPRDGRALVPRQRRQRAAAGAASRTTAAGRRRSRSRGTAPGWR